MLRRRGTKWMSLAVLFLVLLGSAGCGGGQPGPQPSGSRYQDTFVIGSSQEPTTLDPAVVYDGSDRITRLVYESLLQYKGSTPEVEPCLATDWQVSPDGKTYTFNLRRGVKFHDGTPFDAEAVKFSFERMMKIGKGLAWAFNMVIDKVVAVDEDTVEFHLKKPYPGFLGMVADRYGAPIISPSVLKYEKDGDLGQAWATDHCIGTGPYKLVEWTRKQQVMLVKFDDYWKGWEGPHITNVIYKILPDSATQKMMLERGEIHTATHIGVDDLVALSQNPDIEIVKADRSNFNWFVLFNTRKGPFRDIRLRQAVSYAFNYKDTVEKVFQGYAVQARGPVASGVPGHNPNVRVYQRDIEKARQLMAEAGYPNGGFTVTVTHGTHEWANKILEVLTSALGELGISVQSKPLTWGAMLDNMSKQETAPDLVIADWWDDYPDPDAFLRGMAESFWWGGRDEKDYFYYNPEVKKLLEEAAFEPDAAKRSQMFARAQELVVEDVAGVWVLDYLTAVPFRKGVKGFVFNPYYILTYNVYDMTVEAR